MNIPLVSLAVAIGLALLAGTLRAIKQNLIRRSPVESRPIVIEFFQFLESLTWLCVLLAVIAAAPHPITIVLVALFVVSIMFVNRSRYREEAQSLNRWLKLGADTGGSLPVLVESLAVGCRSRLSWQAKGFVSRILRGESVIDAARRSRLPLAADTIAAITIPASHSTVEPVQGNRLRGIDSQDGVRQDHESSQSAAFVSQQFVYVITIMLLAWLIGMAVRAVMLPHADQMFAEYSIGNNLPHDELRLVTLIANGIIIVMAIWLLPAAIIRWLPLWMIRAVPWFGSESIDRWRCEVLRTLGRGMGAGQPAAELLQFSGSVTRTRWIRRRCGNAGGLVEQGHSLPLALQHARMISPREQAWLSSAEKNGNLATAVEHLARNIQRRQTLKWKLRVAWLIPLATVLVAVFVLAHAVFLFQFLTAIINY